MVYKLFWNSPRAATSLSVLAAATSLSVLAAATTLSALAQEVNDGFRLNTAYILYGKSITHISDTITPTGFPEGTPNNLGKTEKDSITLGLSASFSARLSGGIHVSGIRDEGSLEQRTNYLDNESKGFGYSAYLDYKLFGPISLGVFAGQTSMSGTLSNTPASGLTDRANFSSQSHNLGGYLATILPVDEHSAFRLSLAYNTSRSVTQYDELALVFDAATKVKNEIDILNSSLVYMHKINGDWRVHAGLTAGRVIRQVTPAGDTDFASILLTPAVGLIYRFNENYDVFANYGVTFWASTWWTSTYTLGLSYKF